MNISRMGELIVFIQLFRSFFFVDNLFFKRFYCEREKGERGTEHKRGGGAEEREKQTTH